MKSWRWCLSLQLMQQTVHRIINKLIGMRHIILLYQIMEAECWKKKESTESGDRFYRQLSGERRECTLTSLFWKIRHQKLSRNHKYEDEIYKLYPTDIYYIETIDRRTYLYTASQVYESSENLQWIVWKKIVICKERNGYILWVLRAPDEYRKVIYRDENSPDEVSLRSD